MTARLVACPDCDEGPFKRSRGLAAHRLQRHPFAPKAEPIPTSEWPWCAICSRPVPVEHDFLLHGPGARNAALACPWRKCSFVAATIAERNQHVNAECPQRKPLGPGFRHPHEESVMEKLARGIALLDAAS